MKKLSQILAVAAILLAPFAISTGASAGSTCQVGYHLGTGPDSTNVCISDIEYECTVQDDTNIAIVNQNGQEATSGEVELEGNTSGGFSGSGSATNDNTLTFNVTVSNEGVCEVAATTPVIVTPEVTPTPAPVATTTKTTPAVLPNTNSDATASYIVILASVLGIGAIAAYLFTKVYSRK